MTRHNPRFGCLLSGHRRQVEECGGAGKGRQTRPNFTDERLGRLFLVKRRCVLFCFGQCRAPLNRVPFTTTFERFSAKTKKSFLGIQAKSQFSTSNISRSVPMLTLANMEILEEFDADRYDGPDILRDNDNDELFNLTCSGWTAPTDSWRLLARGRRIRPLPRRHRRSSELSKAARALN